MKKNAITAIYSAAHFFVDLACAFLILGYVFRGGANVFLYYNFCAFALQMPIGIFIDRFGGGHRAAAAGCLLISAAYIPAICGLNEIYLVTAAAAGIGNALFHVGGGVYVLDSYENSGALGVFVSPGAIGLYLGKIFSSGKISPALPVISMLISAAVIFAAPYISGCESKAGAPAENALMFKLNVKTTAAAVLFFAVVVIRSYGGFAVSFPWKTAGMAAFAAVFVTAGGKTLGGFVSDKAGMTAAASVSMLSAAVLYLFSDNMLAGLAAVLLFNMSMPITLRGAADIFDGGRGFSFGLLTFALFIGYIPSYVSKENAAVSNAGMCVLCILSAAMLITGFMLCRKDRRHGCGNT